MRILTYEAGEADQGLGGSGPGLNQATPGACDTFSVG